VIIVEAKGGKSQLGKKRIGKHDYQKGTPEYAQAITNNMKRNKVPGAATDRKAAKAINKAAKKEKSVRYLHVQTPITKTESGSTVSEVKISEFNINLKELAGK